VRAGVGFFGLADTDFGKMGKKSRSVFAVGVFAMSALVTYNAVAFAHGHKSVGKLGRHMDSRLTNFEDKHDAFSFEPRVVAKAAARGAGGGDGGGGQTNGGTTGTNGDGVSDDVHKKFHHNTPTEEKTPSVSAARKRVSDSTHEQSKQSSSESGNQLIQSSDSSSGDGKFHVLLTANDSAYQRWQSRVMYYQFCKLKTQFPNSALGGFTRILHSGVPDSLMDEIPTVVVDTLPSTIDDEGYVVLHRPFAFQQWLNLFADKIPEKFVLMSEPDHLFIKPPPLVATQKAAVAFPFFYIAPNDPKYKPIVDRFNTANAPPESFAPIGSSPVMISLASLKRVVPKWHALAIAMKKDKEANAAFGWVVEMWAYSIAAAQVGVVHELAPHFMLQPPYDKTLRVGKTDAFIIHYTYGDDYDKNGVFTPGVNQATQGKGGWHFDKRDFSQRAPKKGELVAPPANSVRILGISQIPDDCLPIRD